MTAGPATLTALIATVLATLAYVIVKRVGGPDWLAMALFGLLLVVVVLAGPLIRLP